MIVAEAGRFLSWCDAEAFLNLMGSSDPSMNACICEMTKLPPPCPVPPAGRDLCGIV